MKAEICGVLIGVHDNNQTQIEDCIAGAHSDKGGAHVTFTQDTWEHIYQIKDRDFPTKKIVGWYHSHPGFGVFLSEHDLFIHQNFFSAKHQVAWVYDPHSDEDGCFVWENEKINRIETIEIIDTGPPAGNELQKEPDTIQIPEEDAEHKPSKSLGISTSLIAALCFFTALIGYILGKVAAEQPLKEKEEIIEIKPTEIRLRKLAKDIQKLPDRPRQNLIEQIAFFNRIPEGYSIVEAQPRQVVGGAGLPEPDKATVLIHYSTNSTIQSYLARLHAQTVNFHALNMPGNIVLRDWQIPRFLPSGLLIIARDQRSQTIAATLPYNADFQARLKQAVRQIKLTQASSSPPGNATQKIN